MRQHRVLWWGIVAFLVAGHLFDLREAVPGLIMGLFPWDLLYHLLWMALAAMAVLYLTEIVWVDDD